MQFLHARVTNLRPNDGSSQLVQCSCARTLKGVFFSARGRASARGGSAQGLSKGVYYRPRRPFHHLRAWLRDSAALSTAKALQYRRTASQAPTDREMASPNAKQQHRRNHQRHSFCSPSCCYTFFFANPSGAASAHASPHPQRRLQRTPPSSSSL